MSLVDQVVLLSLFAGTVGLIVVIVLTGWWIMPKAPGDKPVTYQEAVAAKQAPTPWLMKSKEHGLFLSMSVIAENGGHAVEIGFPESVDGVPVRFVPQGPVGSASIK